MVLPSALQGPKQPTAPDRVQCPMQPHLQMSPSCLPSAAQGVSKPLAAEQPPVVPHLTVLTVLAVHPIISRRALADVVSEDVPPVWNQLAFAIVVARIGVAGAWGRAKWGERL